ncbi:MAG: peptidase C1 [Acidobacteriota bacterium]
MRRSIPILLSTVVLASISWAATPPPTPTPARDRAVYQPKHRDPVLKEMEDAADAAAARAAEETARVRAERKAASEEKESKEKTLRLDVSAIVRPTSPEVFTRAFHTPPVAQYNTGTCWSFATTSFFESEVHRLSGRAIKLSEIWSVYWEYLEKLRGFLRARGDSLIAEGSQPAAVIRAWRLHGAVPAEAYPGVLTPDGRHDHSRLEKQLQDLAAWAKEHDVWDEERVLTMARAILDRELGAPPERVQWEGRTLTPEQFLDEVLGLRLDDYVAFVSTLEAPFWTRAEYTVPDNWWHDASYVNVPLDDWYRGLLGAVESGYTVAIGGDVSEPGYYGFEDIAVVPTFDIPAEYIDQSARELRFVNRSTEDDHLLHVVGHARAGGKQWFLIKDSARSSRWGKFEGYYFYREDYVKLKMLTYTVHRDAVKETLEKIK